MEENKKTCLLIKFNDGQCLYYNHNAKDYYEIVDGFLIVVNGEIKEAFNVNTIKMFKEY